MLSPGQWQALGARTDVAVPCEWGALIGTWVIVKPDTPGVVLTVLRDRFSSLEHFEGRESEGSCSSVDLLVT